MPFCPTEAIKEMSHANAPTDGFFGEGKVVCNPQRGLFVFDGFGAQAFDVVAGVDADGTGGGAQAVGGAGFDASVGEIVHDGGKFGGV